MSAPEEQQQHLNGHAEISLATIESKNISSSSEKEFSIEK